VHPAPLLAAALLLAAPPPETAPPPPGTDVQGAGASLGGSFGLGAGYAVFRQQAEDGPRRVGGLALTGRAEELGRRLGGAITLTWGLTDWDRAGEYIQAGNRAGRWTTDSLARVEAWVSNAPKEQKAARLLGAFFADTFLVLSYAAVPFCYVSSAGGATSHVQLDMTFMTRIGEGTSFGYLEGGLGLAETPYRIVDWREAFGPVAGIGMQVAGAVRIGMRAFWSPPALNDAPFGGSTMMGALILSTAR
jgi:hypothetical protein